MPSPSYTLIAERALPDIGAAGRHYRHASGAEVLSLVMDDPSRVFGIAFRTLPADSTGVAHILEHSVLCGSARFSGREPFVELMKGSLQTFLNAMTMPDLTTYPVASPSEADFRNLVAVYLDAVFAPILSEATFRQEAWRLERGADGTPGLHGIVYNEMKGHFSSPRGVLDDVRRRALFPDTVYGVSYGGDPPAIPELTHAELTAFHRRFYAPANALVFVSGPDEPDWLFEAVGAYLRGEPGRRAGPVAPQPAFAAPRRVRAAYAGPVRQPRRDGFVAVAWALPAGLGRGERLAWRVLDRVLVGAPAAILRSALVEGGLAEDLVMSGFAQETVQPAFHVAVSGADPAEAERIEAVALATLGDAAAGLSAAEVEAALNSVEFALREGPAGPVPPGIGHMMTALATWPHGVDPLAALEFGADLAELRRGIAAGERPLERLLGALLATPHRVTVVLEADPALAARQIEEERARVAAMVVAESPASGVAGTTGAVPLLRLSDLAEEVPADAVEARRGCLVQELPTRGIVYLDLGLDLTGLALEELPAARLLGTALIETGTARWDHVELARRIGTATGGIAAVPWAAPMVGGGTEARLFLRGKALAPRAADLAEILREAVLTARLDDAERLREVVVQEKARAEARLVPMGHEVVDRRLRAALSPAGAADEALSSVTYLRFLRDAAAGTEALAAELMRLRDRLLGRGAILGLVGDAGSLRVAEPEAEALVGALDRGRGGPGGLPWPLGAADEALATEAQVSFVGLGGDLHGAGLAPSGAAAAAARHLGNTWLWDKVRVEGGAYGAQCRFDPVSGIVTMLSYRDPNVLATLAVYREAGGRLARGPSPRDLTGSVIATVGALDRPQPPGARGFTALQRLLTGRTTGWRNARRRELLAAGAEDFAAFGAALDAMAARVVVLGGAEALDRVEAERPGWLARSRVS